jgi:hypothetical protein
MVLSPETFWSCADVHGDSRASPVTAHVFFLITATIRAVNLGILMQRNARKGWSAHGKARGGGATGGLELLPEDKDDDPELQMPEVPKHSKHALSRAGLRSFWDYFVLCTPPRESFFVHACRFSSYKVVKAKIGQTLHSKSLSATKYRKRTDGAPCCVADASQLNVTSPEAIEGFQEVQFTLRIPAPQLA